MSSYDIHSLKLEALSNSGDEVTLNLDENFFTSLGQEEILGGLLAIKLTVQKRAGNNYHINYRMQGHVVVHCDRCFDALSLPLEIEEVVIVATYDDDGYTLLDREGTYDATEDFVETILAELPMTRTHEEGQCSLEQANLLSELLVE